MSALPRPDLPPGPARTLVEELHALHHRAGWPSLRMMAREVGCSHTTVSAAFSDPRVPRWGLLELLVETLDGDTEAFHLLWLAATAEPEPERGPARSDPSRGVRPDHAIPHQLPPAADGFVGRAAEQESLDQMSLTPGGAMGARVVLVHGPAGVGKTSLAVHWARRRAGHFPDGELFVDLRGYDVQAPLTANEALAMLLRSLGANGAAVPLTRDERSAAFRTLMADKRMLVLLDNVHAVDQVRDLLPGSPGSLVLVTSRSQLPGLVVRHGAVRVGVDLLPAADAVDLLRGLVGERVDEDPQAAGALSRQCARLPLALRIAADLVVARTASGMSDLVTELDEESERLSLLGVDQDYGAVRSVFSWSWRHLDADATRAFALLGAHPGRDISLRSASELLAVPERIARATLGELVRASLLVEPERDRYVAHDLLRQYAVEELAALPDEDRLAAGRRLDASYVGAAAAALRALHGISFRGARGLEAASVEDAGDPAQARAWLATETGNALALALACGVERWPTAGILARVLSDYLDERGLFDDAMRVHGHARDVAQQVGDLPRLADATDDLARVLRRLGSYDEAERLHHEALSAYRGMGDERGCATSLHRLGVLEWRQGRYRAASDHLHEALALFTRLGDAVGQGNAGYALAIALRRLGDYDAARARHEEALAVLRSVGDRRGEAAALNNLGMVLMLCGDHDLAGLSFAEALECHLDLRQPIGVAVAWDNLGSLANRRGRHDEALACHRTALEEFVRLGYPAGEADSRRGIGIALAGLGHAFEALDELSKAVELGGRVGEVDVEMNAWCELGRVLLLVGHVDDSESAYAEVMRLADSYGDRLLRATALAGLSDVHEARGEHGPATVLRTRAAAEFDEMGIPAPVRTPARLDPGQAGSRAPLGD